MKKIVIISRILVAILIFTGYKCDKTQQKARENKQNQLIETKEGDTHWEEIKNAITNCEVDSMFQAHNLEVSVSLKNWTTIHGIEPAIDNIIHLANTTKEKCGEILIGTE